MKHYSWSKFSFTTIDDSFGRDGANAMQVWANANDASIIALKYVKTKSTYSESVALMSAVKATNAHIHIQHLYGDPATDIPLAAHSAGTHETGNAMLATWMSGNLVRQKVISEESFRVAMQGYLTIDFKENGGTKGANFQTRWENLDSSAYTGAGAGTYDTYIPLQYDTVFAIAHAIHAALTASAMTATNNYATVDSLPYQAAGAAMHPYLEQVEFLGVSGTVKFDDRTRADPEVDIFNVNGTLFNRVGRYKKSDGLSFFATANISWPVNDTITQPYDGPNLADELLILVPGPYEDKKLSAKIGNNGNDDFGGYSVDIFNEIVKNTGIKIKYEMYCTKCAGSGGWTGMLQRVAEGHADGAVGTITVTAARSMMVTFSTPFINDGLVLLVPTDRAIEESRFWGFLAPFRWDLWLLFPVTTVLLSIIFSIFEGTSRGGEFKGTWMMQLREATWYSWTCYFGTQEHPVNTWRGRVLSWTWCFVILVAISSYTANTASFLTTIKFETSDITSPTHLRGYKRPHITLTSSYQSYNFHHNIIILT